MFHVFSPAPKSLEHRKNPAVLLMASISKGLVMGGERGLQEGWEQRTLLGLCLGILQAESDLVLYLN